MAIGLLLKPREQCTVSVLVKKALEALGMGPQTLSIMFGEKKSKKKKYLQILLKILPFQRLIKQKKIREIMHNQKLKK